jgi:hypothetical protein
VPADDVTTAVPVRLDFDARAPEVSKALARLDHAIVAINAWNAIGVSTHTWVPGSYDP